MESNSDTRLETRCSSSEVIIPSNCFSNSYNSQESNDGISLERSKLIHPLSHPTEAEKYYIGVLSGLIDPFRASLFA